MDKEEDKEESMDKEEDKEEEEEEENVLSKYEQLRLNNIKEREEAMATIMDEIIDVRETHKKVTFNLLKKKEPAKKKVGSKRKTFEEENAELEGIRKSMRKKSKSKKAREAEEAESWM